MNGIIDLSDVMPGSQLYNLPKVLQEKTIQTLTKDVYVIKNTMENVEFYNMLMKVEYFYCFVIYLWILIRYL